MPEKTELFFFTNKDTQFTVAFSTDASFLKIKIDMVTPDNSVSSASELEELRQQLSSQATPTDGAYIFTELPEKMAECKVFSFLYTYAKDQNIKNAQGFFETIIENKPEASDIEPYFTWLKSQIAIYSSIATYEDTSKVEQEKPESQDFMFLSTGKNIITVNSLADIINNFEKNIQIKNWQQAKIFWSLYDIYWTLQGVVPDNQLLEILHNNNLPKDLFLKNINSFPNQALSEDVCDPDEQGSAKVFSHNSLGFFASDATSNYDTKTLQQAPQLNTDIKDKLENFTKEVGYYLQNSDELTPEIIIKLQEMAEGLKGKTSQIESDEDLKNHYNNHTGFLETLKENFEYYQRNPRMA